MRSTRNPHKLTCTFVDDDPGGGCIVITPDGEMNTKSMGDYDTPFYIKDGREIFYPGWCEW